MKIINNMKLFFLVLIFAAYTCGLITSYTTKKSETVFEFFKKFKKGGSNAAADGEDAAATPSADPAKTAPADTTSADPAKTAPADNAAKVEGQQKNEVLEEWFYISSEEFKNKQRFPHIHLRNGMKIRIRSDDNNYRLNPSYNADSKDENSPVSPISFWFRLTGTHLYYSYSKIEFNLAGAILIESIQKLNKHDSHILYCIQIGDHDGSNYTMCNDKEEVRDIWWIQINKNLGIDLPEFQKSPQKFESKLDMSKFEKFEIEEKIIQPIIMVPLPRKKCNEHWDYKNNGVDWECTCKEGREQSPIDLPSPLKAIDSAIAPEFQFQNINLKDHSSSLDGSVTSSELNLRYFSNAVRLLYPDFGKLVTLDESVYNAEEIVFHTPAEHTINGVRYDMEMQILYYGRSVGDIAKQVVVSFLFKRSPGAFVKFFESFDILSLPNQLMNKSLLVDNIDIKKIFYDIDYTKEIVLKPFSFFTYQGSLSFPPCTERTIHYVASKPILLGGMIIDHFREAIGNPQYTDTHYFFDNNNNNYREVQPLNDREIFHWNHEQYCPKDPIPQGDKQPEGHYEKIMTKVWHYYYINSPEDSGLKGSKKVTEQEAKKLDKKP